MLNKLQNDIFLFGLLAAGFIGCWLYVSAYDLMAIGSLLAFVSQMSLLLFFAKEDRTTYSEKTLFVVVFVYSLLLGTVFMALSYIYDGDTFMFTKSDAMEYYNVSMRASDVGFDNNAAYIFEKYHFEDWGSLLFDSFLMSLIPDKLFLNFAYMLTGAISSVLLFRICRHYMSDAYAFVGSLAYGTSSFLIFFHCTFLKESLFSCMVVCTMYHLCRLVHKESGFAPFGFAIFLGILFLFRPAVAAFSIMSFFVYFAIKQHGSALSLFIYMTVLVLFIVALRSMMDMVDRYTAGSDYKQEISGNAQAYSGGFNTFVNMFGGFFGPFPTLFTKANSEPSPIQFYASGLTYRLFLILPFLTGLYLIFKNKVLELFPIVVFILVEMLATGMVSASLELRKVMPHISLTYIVSFYGLYNFQNIKLFQRIPSASIYIIAIGILLLWNVIKG